MDIIVKKCCHAPLHIFMPESLYIVTASTIYKEHFFKDYEKLRILHDALIETAELYQWNLQAWTVFSNHYHFIAKSSDDPKTLKNFIQKIHSQTAIRINQLDHTKGRQVWFQYWDTCITYEKSYYARLNYVHNNSVKHGLVESAKEYPFCSAKWFELSVEPEFREKVKSFAYDKVNVVDDF